MNNDIVTFYNYVVEQYEIASKKALNELKEHSVKGALLLAIASCVNYTSAQYTVDMVLPNDAKKVEKKPEKEKKDKKPEKEKKDKKPEKDKKEKKDKKSSEK